MIKSPEFVETALSEPMRVRNPIIRLLGGLRFGLGVLFLILVASTIGEFLPQDQQNNLALRIVFHTWWYRALLALQALCMVCNTIITYVEETRPQFLPMFRDRADSFGKLKINHKAAFEKTGAKDAKSLLGSLAGVFHARGYKGFFDGKSYYGHRGLYARFGSTVTHIGLITILGGALTESFFKEAGVVVLLEGETADGYYAYEDSTSEPPPHPLGLSITCRDFEFREYPGTATPSLFKSSITVQTPGKEPLHSFVRVNHDVTYGGWTFHQESYTELDDITPNARYYIGLAERLPSGEKKLHRFESYVYPNSREVTPVPGHDDLFFSLERDASGRGLIWTVTTKDKVLARGTQSAFGDLRLEMKRFFSDHSQDPGGWAVDQSEELNNPAALIEISSGNTIIYTGWVFMNAEGASAGGVIDIAMLDYDIDAVGGGGKGDETSASIEDRASVTVALRNAEGRPVGEPYRLRKGESHSLVGASEAALAIPGDFELEIVERISTYITQLSVSKNPGIPIVWLGAILASFGPVIAFFVSRRRVWAMVDWKKQTVWVGGESRYSREALTEEIAEAMREWSGLDEVELEPAFAMPVPGAKDVALERDI